MPSASSQPPVTEGRGPEGRGPADRGPADRHEDEWIGERDLGHWRSGAGRAFARLVTLAAAQVARLVRWSIANVALVLTAGIGLAIAVGLNSVAAEVYEDVAAGDGIATVDQPVLDAAVSLRTPMRDALATDFTDLGGQVLMPVIAVVVAVGLALWKRRWTPVVLMTIAGLGGLAITVSGKELTARARPPQALAVPPFESSPSFPSGHTLNATVVLGIAAYLLVIWLTRRWWRVTVVVVAAVLVLGMGLSRVFLGHHWLTDVIAGWAVGLGWLATVITGHRVKITLDRGARTDR